MILVYPAIFHKEDGSVWVEFPDLIGCQSFGSSIAETFFNASEALKGYCTVILEHGEILPEPSDICCLDVTDNCFSSLIGTQLKIEGVQV